MSAKSAGLHVYSAKPFASAVAAIMASYAGAELSRSVRRNDAATRPNLGSRATTPKRVCRKQIGLWPELGAPSQALARHPGAVNGFD